MSFYDIMIVPDKRQSLFENLIKGEKTMLSTRFPYDELKEDLSRMYRIYSSLYEEYNIATNRAYDDNEDDAVIENLDRIAYEYYTVTEKIQAIMELINL